jgi:pimeloyl-ACP methyl ester carboxylesterase
LSLDLPPVVVRTSLSSPGGPLAALDARPNSVAPGRRPAVLVAGFTGSKEDFLPILGPIADTDRRAVAYDQRGQYQSPGPDDPAAYSVSALADDLLHVVTTIGAPVHVVGHSFGGLVARAAVIIAPDHFASLTLLDSGPAALVGNRAANLELMTPVLREGGVAAVWVALVAIEADDPRTAELPAEVRTFLERRFLSQSPIAVETTGLALLAEPDRVDELRSAYAGPILVACGESDDAWPPDVQAEMAERLDAPFEVIADALHSPAAENPELTAKILSSFWARTGL